MMPKIKFFERKLIQELHFKDQILLLIGQLTMKTDAVICSTAIFGLSAAVKHISDWFSKPKQSSVFHSSLRFYEETNNLFY